MVRMNKVNEKWKYVQQEAKKRGLKIKPDKRLGQTPYRACHPLVEKMVGVKNKGKVLTYDPKIVKTKRMLVMDMNHEMIEMDLMRKGKTYKQAHRVANRKQRSFDI